VATDQRVFEAKYRGHDGLHSYLFMPRLVFELKTEVNNLPLCAVTTHLCIMCSFFRCTDSY
jgi:hypothetical protein